MEKFDVVVAGGGPGGSTAASFLAMQGHRVLLLECERVPRYHIGESLMVSTVQGICGALGVQRELMGCGFVRKPGGVFRWGTGDDLWMLSFTQAHQLNSQNANYALHVERSRFDLILLEGARAKGVVVRQQCAVKEPILHQERVVGVRYTDETGATQSVSARYVVDASGNTSSLYSTVGRRVYSKFFRNIALFCYFGGAQRLRDPYEGGGISEAFDDGWMWFLPLTGQLTSVGAVIGTEQRTLIENREAAMEHFIGSCPHIGKLLAPGRRLTSGDYGEFRVRSDFSYVNKRFWMPGLVLVGDAACFLDPLFTTGVHLATYAGLLAARSINSALRGAVEETPAFDEFEFRYRLELELFYNYVVSFYDMQDTEKSFWRARKVASSGELQNPEFIHIISAGRDEPESYFLAKRGIGARAQMFVDQVKAANDHQRKIAISRAMAEEIHTAFQPPSGPRPFHLGFEDIRTMTWGRKAGQPASVPVSERNLIPTEDGLFWRPA